VRPRAGLDDVEKRKILTLPGLKLRLLRRPARSQSLYRLRYLGSLKLRRTLEIKNSSMNPHIYLNNSVKFSLCLTN
jgi:hypothetical protein